MLNSINILLKQRAQQNTDKVAYYLSGNSDKAQYTYADLTDLAHAYTELFDCIGVAEQTIVACALNNGRALFELNMGSYASNRIMLPLNLVSGDKNLRYVLHHAQPAVIFAGKAEYERMQALAPPRTVVIQVAENHCPLDYVDTALQVKATPVEGHGSNALLMYTSGTTGNPKGVILSADNMIAGGNNTAIAHQLKASDKGLCVLPLYHINAQCVSYMSTLCAGASLVLAERFSVKSFFPLIEQYNVTWASVVPTMLAFLLNAKENNEIHVDKASMPNLRFMRSASAPLPVEVHQKIENLLNIPIIETMGITEAAAQILSNPMPPQERKIGSVGLPFGNEAAVLDTNRQPVGADEEGEIYVRGDNIMQGYYKNPEATEDTMIDGWLRTGDLAKMDADGYIFVSGRSKELIIKGGENIAPREIDEVLYMHPDIVEAAAFGTPCDNYGQQVEACVKRDAKSTVDDRTLMTFCEEQLGSFKTPKAIHFMDELPKGPSGKIQRLKLYDLIYKA